jgi:hypothetical protein
VVVVSGECVRKIGLAEAAARREFELKCAQVPWHVRIRLLEVAAALLRYLERTYGDDALERLDDDGIEAAFTYELGRAVDLAPHDEFVGGAHELQEFASSGKMAERAGAFSTRNRARWSSRRRQLATNDCR